VCGLLLELASSTAFAGNGGSAYSIFGLGDIRYPSGVRSAGMGYTGIGVASPGFINGYSPASWSTVNRVRLEASALYEGYGSTDGSRSRYLARADFNGALLAIPISQPNGIVIVGGFLPFSTVSYDAYTDGSYTGTSDTLQYSIHHTGSGGITRGILGLSYAPLTELSLGLSTNVLFGTVNTDETQVVRTNGYTGGQTVNHVTASGTTFTFGALYTGFGSISPSLQPLSVGVFVTSRGVLSARNQTTYKFTDAEFTTERDTSAEVSRQTTVPFSYGIGLAYQATQRVTLAADYVAQSWSQAVINDQPAQSLRDSYRVGIGVERAPSREIYSSFWDHVAIRFGAYYHATYYQPNNEPINEKGVTTGFAFPFSGDSRLNIALEYARRGTTDKSLVRDNIVRVALSVNIGALWFVQYPEE
jgi:hypothetical protein